MKLSRRDLLKAGAFAGAATSLPLQRMVSGIDALSRRMPASKLPVPYSVPFARPKGATPVLSTATRDYFRIDMRPTQLEILPGYKTVTYAYNGQVPGPTIRIAQGKEAVVRQTNMLPKVHDRWDRAPDRCRRR